MVRLFLNLKRFILFYMVRIDKYKGIQPYWEYISAVRLKQEVTYFVRDNRAYLRHLAITGAVKAHTESGSLIRVKEVNNNEDLHFYLHIKNGAWYVGGVKISPIKIQKTGLVLMF